MFCFSNICLAAIFVIGFQLIDEARAAGLVWEKENQELQAPMTGSKEVEAHFAYKNAGANPVRIKSAKTSCSCVASTVSKDAIGPGESGEIVVTFAYGDRIGRQEKAVTVQTDDPAEPVKVLTFRVFIPELVKIEPELVWWRIGEKPESKRMAVRVQAGAQVGELTAISSSPEIYARLEKGKAEGEYSLVVTPKQTDGPQTAFIRIETGAKEPRAFIAHVRVK